ncbi:glycosyltransferase [Burkholderia cenocepacia]|uniref:glycosyltransferase n=1 Tax=Burkholderia cenocepacia TaxID=95486 RepID=UPI000F59814E|nr:glycosyltransferase [Burkholderia cenocepacia]RQU52918.1 hypothetical protein DF143_32585 [Burkholderia cenocepacia]RQV35038.1 hypothetical protein DF033_31905 [Burkholderia cenocepacia]
MYSLKSASDVEFRRYDESAQRREDDEFSRDDTKSSFLTKFASQIPRVAHFVWIGADVSPDQIACIIDFKSKNPDFKVKLWTDRRQTIINGLLRYESSINRFLSAVDVSSIGDFLDSQKRRAVHQAFLRERYGVYSNLAAAKDIFGLALLDEFGGIILDVDVAVEGRVSLPANDSGVYFYVSSRNGSQFISNGVLASTPRNSKIAEALKHAIGPYMGGPLQYNTSPLWRTLRDRYAIPRADSGVQQEAVHRLFWADKRSNPDARLLLTVEATGPGSLEFARAGRFVLFGVRPQTDSDFPNPASFGSLSNNPMRTWQTDFDASARSWREPGRNRRRDSL